MLQNELDIKYLTVTRSIFVRSGATMVSILLIAVNVLGGKEMSYKSNQTVL